MMAGNSCKRWWILVMCIAIGLEITGCSTTELEERCFPMLVSVGYENRKVTYGVAFPKVEETDQGDSSQSENLTYEVSDLDFQSAKEKYENRLNKDADYNHLKVLVLGDEILEKKGIYQEMIEVLMQTEDFPRNTYVCVADDVDDLYELQEIIPQDLGTYLEEYIKKHEKNKGRLLTLGDLMDVSVNQDKVLYIPYLDVEEEYLEWKGYVNTVGEIWQESLIEKAAISCYLFGGMCNEKDIGLHFVGNCIRNICLDKGDRRGCSSDIHCIENTSISCIGQ